MSAQAQPPASSKTSPQAGSSGLDDQSHVQRFLDDFARHLTAGEAHELAKMWETPALVVSDAETRSVETRQAVQDFFAGAKEQYNSRGITDTRAEIQHVYWLTDRIVMVQVRWPHLDAQRRVTGEESSTYVLRMDDEDNLRMRVVIMQGAKDAH